LLERFPPDVPAALRRIGGLQAQYAPATYVGLWSRVAGLERDTVTRALEDRIANWAGLKIGDVKPALARAELRRFRGPAGEELLDLPDAPLPEADTPAPVRFLPVWDASLLVHARRTGILPEELRPRVFTIRRPHGVSTFLVDGAVAGAWQFEDGRVTLEPFRRLDAADRRAVDAEAERLAAFAG
jgi:hypothetical protein